MQLAIIQLLLLSSLLSEVEIVVHHESRHRHVCAHYRGMRPPRRRTYHHHYTVFVVRSDFLRCASAVASYRIRSRQRMSRALEVGQEESIILRLGKQQNGMLKQPGAPL